MDRLMKFLFPRQVARYENKIDFLQEKHGELITLKWEYKLLEAKLRIYAGPSNSNFYKDKKMSLQEKRVDSKTK